MLYRQDKDESISALERRDRGGLRQARLPTMTISYGDNVGIFCRLVSDMLKWESSYECWAPFERWSSSETPVYLAFPAEDSEELPSTDQAAWLPTVLENDEVREYAAELGAAAAIACKTGELELLAEVLADWHATAEILADEEIIRELQEGSDEKGRSWREIRESLLTV